MIPPSLLHCAVVVSPITSTLVLNAFGVIELEALDAVDVPFALVAVTVNVYSVPITKVPVTVKGLDVPEVLKAIEGLEVTVYEVIGNLLKGAVNVSDTVVEFVTVAVPTVGVVGTPFVPAPCDPRIGIKSFYPTLFVLTVDLADI